MFQIKTCQIINIVTLCTVCSIIFLQICLFFNCFESIKNEQVKKTIARIRFILVWIQRTLVILLFFLLIFAIYCAVIQLQNHKMSSIHPAYHGESQMIEPIAEQIISAAV